MRDEYQQARATILAGEEDFGMVPVEAQACGRPVVALARGGALETVQDGDTGLLFDEPTAESLAAAITRLDSRIRSRPARLRAHAETFSRQRHLDQPEGRRGRHRRTDAGHAVVRRYNRLLVAFYVATDALLATWAFVLAYAIRFESGAHPGHEGLSPARPVPAGRARSWPC